VKGRIGRVSPMKSKVIGKSDSHKSRWVPMSERVSNQSGDIVLSPQPVSQYNPVTGHVVKESDTAPVVIEKSIGKADCCEEKPAVVKEKPAVVKDKHKTEKNSKVLDNPKESDKAADVIESDKHKVDVVKPSNVVADKAINVVADKVDMAKDKINVQYDPAKVVKESVLAVAKNKPAGDGKNSAPDVVKERRKTMLPKYKPNNKASTEFDQLQALFQKDKVLNVVSKDKPKGNASFELPKKKDKADIPKDKHKVHSEVPVLRSKPEVKAKASVYEDVKLIESQKRKIKAEVKRKRKGGSDSDSDSVDEEDHSKKKPEVDSDSSSDEVSDRKPKKGRLRLRLREKKGGWDSDSDSVDEEKLRRMLRKFKKIKEEDSSSESGLKSNKKGKKKEKHSNEESGLKSNKKGKKKEKQLTPEEAAHEEYLREFPTIRARTTSNSLFSAIRKARVDMWSFLQGIGFSSFYNVSIDNLPSRLGRYALSKFDSETYRVTFETGDYVEVTPSKINDMLGIPIGGISLFLLDVRPIEHEFVRMWVNQFYPKSLKDIRLNNVASKVISAHQNLETKEHVIGCLELHSEWTESELHDTEGFTMGSSFENSEKEYFQLFKEHMSFNDDADVNGDDDVGGDGDGDDDGNRDDDVRGDSDMGNGDDASNGDDDGNGDDVDGIDHGDGNLNSCKSIEKQVDATTKENVVEEEFDYITCTPESYTQWLDANSDFVIEMIDCVGEALDAIDEDMRRNNEGTVTPKRLNTRHSKASPSPNKRMFVRDAARQDTMSMFDGTLSTDEDKWKSFAAEVSAQFKDNVEDLALSGIDLYRKCCSASHLRLYGHERHSKIGRLKARIPKLKWKTKANVKDCGIFTMLHMESYMGQTAKTWDCGLVAESKQQCDMLRQLRFKFATKILLHEINVHAQKMIRYAEEFDKIVGFQKMCIVVDALKNREEREKN
ncbi:hypothetical protein Tco_0677702, partial [Tanacetum coccineum]